MDNISFRNFRFLLPLAALFWLPAQAANLSIPNSFTANTPARAAEVNANFSAVEAAVDDNDARIAQLESQIASLLNTVNNLQSLVSDLEDELSAVTTGQQFVTDLQTVMEVDTDNDRVVFSGVNLQIHNGAGATATVNGLGNLIVGYDEARTIMSNKSGSHNLVLGREHNYSSYGGLVAGFQNTVSGISASVSGGAFNTANGDYSSVSAGSANFASGLYSSVSAGISNKAEGEYSSVSGGNGNIASGNESSVTGGIENEASGQTSTVSGGNNRVATDIDDWAAGGQYEDNQIPPAERVV